MQLSNAYIVCNVFFGHFFLLSFFLNQYNYTVTENIFRGPETPHFLLQKIVIKRYFLTFFLLIILFVLLEMQKVLASLYLMNIHLNCFSVSLSTF
jgi:hypothetical protein